MSTLTGTNKNNNSLSKEELLENLNIDIFRSKKELN